MDDIMPILSLLYALNPYFDITPTYKEDAKPIFSKRCSSCHDSLGDMNWQKYENAYKWRYQIREKMITKDMPKGKDMPQEERDKLIRWVDGGAKE